jgi:hypothetical protein
MYRDNYLFLGGIKNVGSKKEDYLEEPLLDSDELYGLVLPDPVHHLRLGNVLLSLRLAQPIQIPAISVLYKFHIKKIVFRVPTEDPAPS